MKKRIQRLLDYTLAKKHHAFRRSDKPELALEFKKRQLSPMERAVERLVWVLNNEEPVLLPDERIVFTRTIGEIPSIWTEDEWQAVESAHYIHESGRVCNICPDYAATIARGLEGRRADILASLKRVRKAGDQDGEVFLKGII